MVAVVRYLGADRFRRSVWRFSDTNADAHTNADANAGADPRRKQGADRQHHCKSEFGFGSSVSRIPIVW